MSKGKKTAQAFYFPILNPNFYASRNRGKDLDVLARDLDVGDTGVMRHKLSERLFAVVYLVLWSDTPFCVLFSFFHGLLQYPGGLLGGLHAEDNGTWGDCFQDDKLPPCFNSCIQLLDSNHQYK